MAEEYALHHFSFIFAFKVIAEENAFHHFWIIVLLFLAIFLLFGFFIVFLQKRKTAQQNENLHHQDAFNVCGPRICSSWFSPNWNDEKYKRTTMACFVQGAYLGELDRQENRIKERSLAPNWVNHFHFEVTKTLIDPRDESIFGVILKRNRLAALLHFYLMRPSGGAPKAVLALRGTLLKKATIKCDLQYDVRFFARESLEGTARYKLIFEALASLVAKYGEKNVCVAGHSLGAAYALQVAKALANREIIVETHIFNPPSPSLAKCIRSIGNAFRLFKRTLEKIKDESEGLQWHPNLYVNPSDIICCYYIFGPRKERMFVLSKKKQKLREAHALKQWWSDDLEFETPSY